MEKIQIPRTFLITLRTCGAFFPIFPKVVNIQLYIQGHSKDSLSEFTVVENVVTNFDVVWFNIMVFS